MEDNKNKVDLSEELIALKEQLAKEREALRLAELSLEQERASRQALEATLFEERSKQENLDALLEAERSARTGMEAVLKERERQFTAILDGLPMHVFVKDDKNNILYVNEQAAIARGLTRDKMEGQSTYDIYPDDAASYYANDLEVMRSGQAKVGIVEQELSANGEKRWVSSAKFPWRDRSGKIIGILVTASDITDLVRAQDQKDSLMSAVAKALELSEERYYLAIRGSNDGVWDWNLNTNDVFYSPRYKESLGYRDDEFPNIFESFHSNVHPEDLPKVMEAVQAHLEENVPYEAEFRMRRKNGEWSWFSARGQAIWDKARKPYRMAGSQRDITDRKQAEQNVNEFFSTVSHELRTPLSAVKGSLRLIEGGLAGHISNEARELLDIALSSCERLIRLVNDILDLRKIEAGKIELSIRQVSAAELIQEVLQGLASYAESHGVLLNSHSPSQLKFEADHDRIVQVMTNLVGNAIKFSGEGAQVKLTVSQIDDHHVRLSVEDNGPGIPEDKHHLLFMKFKQLDASDSRRQDGTGLGLAICKAIVGQHHGKIGVESKEGQGSTFWFELPLHVIKERH